MWVTHKPQYLQSERNNNANKVEITLRMATAEPHIFTFQSHAYSRSLC